MPGKKRLEKPVRLRADDLMEDVSEDGADNNVEEGSSPSMLDTGEGGDVLSSGGEDGEDGSDMSGNEEVEPEDHLKSVSFGTLAKAQDSLSLKRKRNSDSNPQQEAKMDALRARLNEIKQAKAAEGKKPSKKASLEKPSNKKAKEEKPGAEKAKVEARADDSGDSEEDDSDSSGSDQDEDGPRKSRTSKHAPASQSSKYQVTRKREVVEVPKRNVRDPRFGLPGRVDEDKIGRAYSFIHDYEDKEMDELRAAIKKTKDEDEKYKLRRHLMSMENRKKSRIEKERQQNVIREHRKAEKQAIQEGKQPYYLKRSDIKQQALVNKFEGMKSKDREKAIDKKRKKEAQKEKKAMPAPRRIVG